MFTLLQNDTLYKEVITSTGGGYNSGVWYPGTESKSYEQFSGIVEPYMKEEESQLLPAGVSNESVAILFTSEKLKTNQSLPDDSSVADTIFIEDPETITTAQPYKVWSAQNWTKNQGFQLVEGFYEYLIIRENRK